jgi:hypothetical protein
MQGWAIVWLYPWPRPSCVFDNIVQKTKDNMAFVFLLDCRTSALLVTEPTTKSALDHTELKMKRKALFLSLS